MRRVHWYRTSPVVLRSWLAFILALAIIAAIYYGCWWLVEKYAGEKLIYFKIGAWLAIIIGSLTLIFNEPIVKWSMGAKRIRPGEYPKLWRAVQRAKPWHAGPMPRVYVVNTFGLNAFAFGWGLPGMSAVGATSGIIEQLDDDELQAVMAHEIGHIINKDILVTSAMAIAVMMMAFTGYLLLRVGPYGGSSRRSSSGKGGGALILVMLIAGAILYGFGRLVGIFLQMFVSRQREYAADATSAQIIGSSQPLITALGKIASNPTITHGASEAAFGFLCTADPDETDMMSTHPAMRKRLEALRRLEA